MPMTITDVYQAALRTYSNIPYHFRDGRHSFAPFHYYIEVTRRCNLRCQMCQYIGFLKEVPLKEQSTGELTTDEWKHVLNQIRRGSLITFTGGEAFLRRDMMELIEHACRKCGVHCISNGTLLRQPMIERLVQLSPRRLATRGFFFLGVSLDGLHEVHDHIRAQKGAFERSVKTIRAIVAERQRTGRKYPMIHVTAVVQEDNLDILPRMPAYLSGIGVDVFNLTLENRSMDEVSYKEPITYEYGDVTLPRIERQRLRATLDATRQAADSAGIDLRLPRMPVEQVLNYYDGGLDMREFQCRVPWNTMSIDYKGDVSPCYLTMIGNVRETSLREMWKSQKTRAFRTTARKELWAGCQGCCEPEHRGPRLHQLPQRDGGAPSASKPSTGPIEADAAMRGNG